MIIGLLSEIHPSERRVALVPANVAALSKMGLDILVETGAGSTAGHSDTEYSAVGAAVVQQRTELLERADILVQVQSFGSNCFNAHDDFSQLRQEQVIIGLMDPLGNPMTAATLADKKVTAIAMELVPRITRAQSMDVLSSMATIAGYKAVLLGASHLGRIFPMLMTAAGTLRAARVFIMGAGVAGLQAAATAKRLGAVVEAYDVRPAAREQILSVGAKPIELKIETEGSEGKGGYAKAQSDVFLKRQRELMTEVLAQQDIVITTAAVPGAKSPILITADMVRQMKPGAVIVDLAAERGGNCELTQLNETVEAHGVTILGPENIPASIPQHASQMYGKNMENLLKHLISEDGQINLDFADEIVAETVIAHGGDIPHRRMRELLGFDEKQSPDVVGLSAAGLNAVA